MKLMVTGPDRLTDGGRYKREVKLVEAIRIYSSARSTLLILFMLTHNYDPFFDRRRTVRDVTQSVSLSSHPLDLIVKSEARKE